MGAKGRGPALLPTVTGAGKARGGRGAWPTAAAARARRCLHATAAALALLLVYQLVAYQLHAGGGLGLLSWVHREPTAQELAAREQAAVVAQQREARASMAAAAAVAAERPWDGFLPEPPPRVALLFLVRGAMPLEPLWREFFEAAAQIEPVALPPPWAQPGDEGQAERRRLLTEQGAEADPDPGSAGAGADSGSSSDGGSGSSGGRTAQGPDALVVGQQAGQAQTSTAGADVGEGSKAAASEVQQGQEQPQQQPQQQQQQGQQQAGGVDASLTPEQRQQLVAQRRLWISLASGERVRAARREAMASRTMEAPYSMMSPLDPGSAIARQDLFSVYVHTLPGFHFNSSSVFSGRQIDRRVYVFWGQYSVAEAERRLLAAALADPRNQRFVLLSETCAPLYPPHVLHSQLLSEARSRVNACAPPEGRVVDRWQSAFYIPGLLTPPRWRKSSQWKALLRSHAQLVAADRQLAPRFERECYSYQPPTVKQPPYIAAQNRTWVHRSCIADEHYVPTLLAAHQLDAETTCADSLTAADWIELMWSPRVHVAGEVDASLIRRLRKQRGTDVDCDAAGALASAAGMFRLRGAETTLDGGPLPGADPEAGAGAAQRRPFRQLGDACFLFARKFGPEAVPPLLELAADCQEGTGLAAACLTSASWRSPIHISSDLVQH